MFKKFLSLLLLTATVLTVAACKNNAGGQQSPRDETPAAVEYDLTDVTIIHGDLASQEVQKSAKQIKNSLRQELLLDVSVVKASESAAAKEILVGDTGRAESTAAMAKLASDVANTYRIELAGEKIVIVGSTDLAVERGVDYFTEALLSDLKNDPTLTLASDYSYTDSFGVDTTFLDNGVQIKKQQVSTVYGPAKGNVTPDLTYSRIIQLSHNGAQNGALYATSESLDVEKYLVHRSADNGNTWETVGQVTSQIKGFIANWQPMLYELPCQVGDLAEGTLLLAGCVRNPDTTKTRMCIYKSTDLGLSWDLYTTVAEGGGFSTTGGLSTGLWEPFLLCDDDGKLWCFYSDETDAENHSQMLVCRSSVDGKTWSDTQKVVAAGDKNLRPGMITVTRLGDGRYLATYEIVGMTNNPIYFKITDDLEDWDPSSIGAPVVTKNGEGFGSAPYCCWIPAGGECGTLVVTAMFDYGKTDEEAAKWLISFDYGNTWEAIENPLYYKETAYPDNRYAYSPGLFAGSDGKTIYYVNDVPSKEIKGQRDMDLAILEISRYD